MPAITDKRQMYADLAAGRLGNCIPQFFGVEEWSASLATGPYTHWGVRTLTPGGPCRLNCPTHEVRQTVRAFRPHRPNISVMISCVGQVQWLGDVWESPTGLVCEGHEAPPRVHDWRQMMRTRNRWEGLAARMLLRRHLNPNSLSDLDDLLGLYPGHVVELSALDVCFGVWPDRNAVVWEVRAY